MFSMLENLTKAVVGAVIETPLAAAMKDAAQAQNLLRGSA